MAFVVGKVQVRKQGEPLSTISVAFELSPKSTGPRAIRINGTKQQKVIEVANFGGLQRFGRCKDESSSPILRGEATRWKNNVVLSLLLRSKRPVPTQRS